MLKVKLRHAAALALAGWYALSPPLSWAQSDTKVFTDPDGAFSFRYPNRLIRCKKNPQGNYVWDPPENCSAYHPTCDELADPGQTSIACFAYPRNKFTDTPAFEAATFSVEVVHGCTTAKSCLAGPAEADKGGTTRIHGVSFAVFGVGEGGMSQEVDGDVYRTFHKGKCYQLGINVETADVATFDPPARALTDADRHEVTGTLEQARKSFRFLK